MSGEADVAPDKSGETNDADERPVEDLSDEELFMEIRDSDNGDVFIRLSAGDNEIVGGDASEGYKLMCWILSYWTNGDEARINRMFKGRPRCPDWWDDVPDESEGEYPRTRGELVITAANAEQNEYAADASDRSTGPDIGFGYMGIQCVTFGEITKRFYADDEDDEDGDSIGKPRAEELATDLLEYRYHFATPLDGADVSKCPLFRYDPETGTFEERSEGFVSETIEAKLSFLRSSNVTEIVNRLKRRSLIERSHFDAGKDEFGDRLVCIANGVLDLDTGEVHEHDPGYLFKTHIPRTYDPTDPAECPEIEAFLEDVLGDDLARKTIEEWIGFVLDPEHFLHRFLILHGEGGNGKGMLFRIMREFLGGAVEDGGVVSDVSLKDLAGGGHDLDALPGAWVNIDADSIDARMANDEMAIIKRITGGDGVRINPKFEHTFHLSNPPKLLFGTNDQPRFDDPGRSVARRLLSIEFPYNFVRDPDPDDPTEKQSVPERDLIDRVTTDAELDGLLTAALRGLSRLDANDQFSIEERGTPEERLSDYRSEADPIVGFAESCLSNESGFAVPAEVLHSAFKNYCQDHGRVPTDKSTLSREIGRRTSIELHQKRPRLDVHYTSASQVRVFDGLRITPDGFEYLSDLAIKDIIAAVEQIHPGNVAFVRDELLEPEELLEPDKSGEIPIEGNHSQADRRGAIETLIRTEGPLPRADVVSELGKRGFDPGAVVNDLETMLTRDGTAIRGDDETVEWVGR